MPLNIALVSREYPPGYGGGIGTYVDNMAPALVAAGSRVHVVTEPHPERPRREERGGITVHRVPLGDGAGAGALRGGFEAARVVGALARDEALDLVEFADHEGAALGASLGSPGVPSVVHLHSPTELNLTLNGVTAGEVPRALRLTIAAERWAIENAAACCAPSRFMAEWATRHYDLATPPVVIPYPFPLSGEPTAVPETVPRRLLYVGRLERRKGVDLLVAAWGRVARALPEVTLRLVGADTGTAPGGGSMLAHLRSRLPETIHDRTLFAGPRTPAELADEYARASVCVVPSRWENFPHTCLEAMAAARPVVVSDQGGMREMIGGSAAGLVFRAGDVEDLEQTLTTMLRATTATLHVRGAEGRARVAHLCEPARVARARIDLYRRTLETRATPAPAARRLDVWRSVERWAASAPLRSLPAVSAVSATGSATA